jgi:hypothetical protein
MKKIVMIRTYKTEFEFDVSSIPEALVMFDALDDDYKYSQELEQMDVEEEIKVYNGGIKPKKTNLKK